MSMLTLSKKLRTLRPTQVRAYDQHGTPQVVTVPTRRRKWVQVEATLERMAWSRCELLDADGRVLHAEVGDLASEDQAPREAEDWHSNPLAAVLEGQRLALAAHTEALKPLVDSHVKLANQSADRAAILERQVDRLNTELATVREERDALLEELLETRTKLEAAEKSDQDQAANIDLASQVIDLFNKGGSHASEGAQVATEAAAEAAGA